VSDAVNFKSRFATSRRQLISSSSEFLLPDGEIAKINAAVLKFNLRALVKTETKLLGAHSVGQSEEASTVLLVHCLTIHVVVASNDCRFLGFLHCAAFVKSLDMPSVGVLAS
jgi:hypothetical protein